MLQLTADNIAAGPPGRDQGRYEKQILYVDRRPPSRYYNARPKDEGFLGAVAETASRRPEICLFVSSRHLQKYQYIDTQTKLDCLTGRIKKARRIAVDIEADSFHHYFEKVCLIQIAVAQDIYLVDPLADLELSAFLDVLADTAMIFHDGGYDLRMMRSSFGFEPRGRVFDTMLAAQLLGCRQFGLAAMLQEVLAVSMAKGQQKADWSHRPLSEKLLAYAGDDVLYLEELTDCLSARLKELGRTQWHKESCQWMVKATAVEKEQADKNRQWRIKGCRELTRRQLAFVRQLWRWRDGESRKADRPPFKILGNQQLIHLALWAQNHPKSSLSKGPRLPRHCTGRRFARIEKAIAHAQALPESSWPKPLKPVRAPRWTAADKQLADVLRDKCRQITDRLEIEPFVVAPRATIAVIARKRPATIAELAACGPMMQWQAKLLWPTVKSLLEA